MIGGNPRKEGGALDDRITPEERDGQGQFQRLSRHQMTIPKGKKKGGKGKSKQHGLVGGNERS